MSMGRGWVGVGRECGRACCSVPHHLFVRRVQETVSCVVLCIAVCRLSHTVLCRTFLVFRSHSLSNLKETHEFTMCFVDLMLQVERATLPRAEAAASSLVSASQRDAAGSRPSGTCCDGSGPAAAGRGTPTRPAPPVRRTDFSKGSGGGGSSVR